MQEEGNLTNNSYVPNICGNSISYVEELYDQYLQNPKSVTPYWQHFFSTQWELSGDKIDIPRSLIRSQLLSNAQQIPYIETNTQKYDTNQPVTVDLEHEKKQVRVSRLIASFRTRGHKKSAINPLGSTFAIDNIQDLDLDFHDLSTEDLNTQFQIEELHIEQKTATLDEIYKLLSAIYCSSIGAEFMHINNYTERHWFQKTLESSYKKPLIQDEERIKIYQQLVAAEGLEKYLGSRYPGTKRFGIEGGESLIPLLKTIINNCSSTNTKDLIIGMAHRGRLNVLVNIFGKKPVDLFDEFEGKIVLETGSGDVKYHQGFSSDIKINSHKLHLSLMFNPSHLEIVGPVVQGSVRARQEKRADYNMEQVLPVVIHGDAAFAGQGVVMETLQMSQTRAYKTGGTIHIVINNQVGFTTSNPKDARSSEYCTDVVKILNAPVLHVNGDDPDAVCAVAKIAFNYRMKFKKDIVIDLVCYRRRGHNEADEPSGTQPLMYQVINKLPTTKNIYTDKLINKKLLTQEQDQQHVNKYRDLLDKGELVVDELDNNAQYTFSENWSSFTKKNGNIKPYSTSYDMYELQQLGRKMCTIPEGFVLQKQVAKIINDRLSMVDGKLAINWGCAEMLAYATILQDDYDIRMTGQDVGRGTFAHRHAILHNQTNGDCCIPLNNLSLNKKFNIWDSILSEEAVLAFEYGFASAAPNTMVIWEAQFGDFANGAQVVFDQFISSAEHKWGRYCGLTVLLPHGYEGQGPEHSSARIERYLQLCAEHNMQVCIPTTPAQVFHMLRRQMIQQIRKPLIVFTPKSLLRHKQAVSTIEELATGKFQPLLLEDVTPKKKITKVIFCSGKVYYDLLQYKLQQKITNIIIIRIEQLYPFPHIELNKVLYDHPSITKIVWCQEEPKNQGAWYCIHHNFANAINKIAKNIELFYSGREASAAPACGYTAIHVAEQEKLLKDAFHL